MDAEGRAHKNHVVSLKKVREFLESHPEMERMRGPLHEWYAKAVAGQWPNFARVRETFGSADAVGKFVVFNVGGNKVRLVAEIRYNLRPRVIYIRHVLTHAEYDEIDLEA